MSPTPDRVEPLPIPSLVELEVARYAELRQNRDAELDRRRAELEHAQRQFVAAVTAYAEAVLDNVRPLAEAVLAATDDVIDLELEEKAAKLRATFGRPR